MQIVEDAISRYFFLAAWAGLYLALSYASEAHRVERRADRLERAAQQAELRSLRYQVNPHFLFNTLNSLSSLVMKDRRDEAEQMILSLSNFYRSEERRVGKSVSVRVDRGGRRIIKKKTTKTIPPTQTY